MKIFFSAFVSTIVFCQMVFAQNNLPKGFNIYLLPENIKANQLSTLDLKKLAPKEKPLISQDEILYYRKETHEFRIDYTASARLKKVNDGGGTRTFAVFVGNEPIYVGAFWKSILSQSFDGIIIDTFKSLGKPPYYSNTDFPVLTLEPGYPSPDYFKAEDLRADSRIFKALEEAGKLYEDTELIVKCRKIVGTGKRRQSFIINLEVLSVPKGNFNEKEFQIELFFDDRMFKEFHNANGAKSGARLDDFDPNQEILMKISTQTGKEKPDWFLRGFEKR